MMDMDAEYELYGQDFQIIQGCALFLLRNKDTQIIYAFKPDELLEIPYLLNQLPAHVIPCIEFASERFKAFKERQKHKRYQ